MTAQVGDTLIPVATRKAALRRQLRQTRAAIPRARRIAAAVERARRVVAALVEERLQRAFEALRLLQPGLQLIGVRVGGAVEHRGRVPDAGAGRRRWLRRNGAAGGHSGRGDGDRSLSIHFRPPRGSQ